MDFDDLQFLIANELDHEGNEFRNTTAELTQ